MDAPENGEARRKPDKMVRFHQDTWKWLMEMKLELNVASIDEVVLMLKEIVTPEEKERMRQRGIV